jgi:hypothetical protein
VSKKRKKRLEPKASEPSFPPESRAAEAVTIAWMMAALSSCLGTVLASLLYAVLWFTVPPGEITSSMVWLPFLLFSIATITGAICLLLTPLAVKMRKTPPPRAVIFFALFFGAAPLAASIALAAIY